MLRVTEAVGMRGTAGEPLVNFPAPGCPSARQGLETTRRQAAALAGHERLGLAVSPHSVYTTTAELLRESLAAARQLHLPLHMHLAESAHETATSLELHGQRPIPYCRQLGLLDVPVTLAHVVDVDDAELDILAAAGAVVVHNPSSNMKLASGAARIPDMLQRGIPVALGTDGAASNNRLNMFTEMGRAALLQKLVRHDPTALPAADVLDMATRGGAAALHDARLGSLAVGKAADCLALDLTSPNLLPLYNEVSQLVYAATGMENRMTMVAGQVLYLDGQYLTLDYTALQQDMAKVRAAVLELMARQPQ